MCSQTLAERRGRFNRGAASLAFFVSLAAPACVHLDRPDGRHPPAPLSPGRRAVFGLDGGGPPLGWRKELVLERSSATVSRVDLVRELGGDPVVSFELHEPTLVAPPWPAVIVSPILKGGYVLERWVAGVLSSEGIAVAIPLQSDDPLPKEKSPEELAAAFLESVRSARAVVDWLAASDRVDPTRLGSVGTSLGALRNVVLLAGEPRLRANVLALGGLDVGWILGHSAERSVALYRRERARIEGIGEEELRRRLHEAFWFHDRATALAVDGGTVLLILARFDSAVPPESGGALRDALRLPESRVIPFAHYTSLVSLPFIRVWLVDFFRERFGLDRRRTERRNGRAASHARAARRGPRASPSPPTKGAWALL